MTARTYTSLRPLYSVLCPSQYPIIQRRVTNVAHAGEHQGLLAFTCQIYLGKAAGLEHDIDDQPSLP